MYIFYKGKRQITLLLTAIIMFILSTTSIIISLCQGASAYGNLDLNLAQLQIAGAIVYVTNNIIADGLLIYRCYVIWNTVYITIVPLLLLIATMILGYSIQLKLFFILSLSMNLFVPTLVGEHLRQITRASLVDYSADSWPNGALTRRKGRNAMVIILESGLIYSVVVSVHMVYFHTSNPMDEVIYGALGQIVGIVPTLIIVRVGLGVSQNASYNRNSTLVDSDVENGPSTESGSSTFPVQFTNTVVISQEPERSGWDSETIV
ncbi:hypothetical protein K438DRAFT_1883302 [Mycena galopus ATCC 62051]|nr:hypothetical protein K438DRAFT_1883302 [Mycena galopus ATCC 62051]